MNKLVVYIVTNYGCNSNPSDMWMPISKIFVNYEEAYAYFLKVAPSLDDEYETEQFVNHIYNDLQEKDIDYIIIENRVQMGGYNSNKGAKRPEGTVIARSIITPLEN